MGQNEASSEETLAVDIKASESIKQARAKIEQKEGNHPGQQPLQSLACSSRPGRRMIK